MKKRLFRLGALCCVAAMTITTGAQALSVEEAYDILQRSYVCLLYTSPSPRD